LDALYPVGGDVEQARVDPEARLSFNGDTRLSHVAGLFARSSNKVTLFDRLADNDVVLPIFCNQFNLRARRARCGGILHTEDGIVGGIGGLFFAELGIAQQERQVTGVVVCLQGHDPFGEIPPGRRQVQVLDQPEQRLVGCREQLEYREGSRHER